MAIVYPDLESSAGASRGVHGISIPPQKYIILFENEEDRNADPTLILQTHPNGVPYGSEFKYETFPAICTGYQLGEPIGQKGREVFATYTPITIAQTGWRANIRGFIDTQNIIESVEENENEQEIIGGRVYIPATGGPTLPGQPPPNATHVATSLLGESIYLQQTTRRQELGWDVPKPGLSLYLFRDDIPATFNIANVWAAANYLGKVNSNTFWGHFPVAGTVLMTEIALEELPGPAANEAVDYGYHYGAQLRFDIRPAHDRYSPVRIFDTVEDADANKAFVRVIVQTPGQTGDKVWTDFVVIRPADLNGVFPFLTP